MKLFVTIVLDGVGIGAAPDAAQYGDEGSDTLGHVCDRCRPELPNLAALGLGNIRQLTGVDPASKPSAAFGMMQEVSAGKDSTSGHWELAGIIQEAPFPTYPEGFPPNLINKFLEVTGCTGVLGNRAESGTVIITELGDEHRATGFPIVYTSADSVFQIAAHVDVIPPEKLYEMCVQTRERVCVGEHAVGRVIARPFAGGSGSSGAPGASGVSGDSRTSGTSEPYARISNKRRDFSLVPPPGNILTSLQTNGIKTVSVGKVSDLFAGEGFSVTNKTSSNAHGVESLVNAIQRARVAAKDTFIWVNLIDFDQEYGHRNDPDGFAASLEEFDRLLPGIVLELPDDARLVITADHGNDPVSDSTDHSREYVPILYLGVEDPGDLGIRSSFCDHAATVAAYFGVPFGGSASTARSDGDLLARTEGGVRSVSPARCAPFE